MSPLHVLSAPLQLMQYPFHQRMCRKRLHFSHHVHFQYLWRGLVHLAEDGFFAQLLVCLESVAPAEPIVLALDLQHVNWLEKTNFFDADLQCVDFFLVCTRQMKIISLR